MDKKVKNILSYVFWGALALVLVYFCLRRIDWAVFFEALKDCRWGFILLAMFLGAATLYVRAVRWRMQLQPIDPNISILTCFNAYNIGMVSNMVLPRAGEIVKLGYIVRDSSVSFDKALGTLITERTWDALVSISMLLVFSHSFVQSILGADGIRTAWWVLAGVILMLALFLFLCWKLKEKGHFWGKVWGFIAGIGQGLLSFRQMKNGWLFLLYTALIWILYWFTSASILWALQGMEAFAPLNMADAFNLMVVGSVSSLIPVPGGFGVYHLAVAGYLLNTCGIPESIGLIYATLNHESQVIIQAFCGLASYLHESFFRRKK